tara:strand:+ start:7552 stop:8172 length:621 start_codon:yes stop_codon:yes gene_type:complete
MAKKNLLNEAQIRRFQSLASIHPVNEGSYYNEVAHKMEEEEMEEGKHNPMAEMDHGMEEEANPMAEMDHGMEEGAHEDGKEEEKEEVDVDADLDGDGDTDVDLEEDDVEKLVAAFDAAMNVVDKLRGALGMGDEPADEPAMDMEPAPEMDMEMGAEETELMEALADVDFVGEQSDVVEEVARRVAKRLQEAKKAQKALNKALGNKK